DQPGSYSQQTRLLRDDGRPAFSFHTFSVYIATQTLRSRLARAPKNRQFRTLPGDSSAILAPRHADSLPLDPTDRSKPRLSMGDRANSITSAHRARRQPRSILLRFALARAFAHTTACSLIVVTESCIAMVPQNGLGDRASSRPDLEFGKVRGRLPWPPNRAPAGHRSQLERLDSENISQRLDFNFLSRLEKISGPAAKTFPRSKKSALGQENMRGLGVWTLTFFGVDGKNFQSPKHRPARDALPSSENPRQVKAMRATWSFGL
ncbi:unnamed protein product, partial [Clavelina lepadiformis]